MMGFCLGENLCIMQHQRAVKAEFSCFSGAEDPYCYAMANSESAGGYTWFFFGCDATPGVYDAAMTPTSKATMSLSTAYGETLRPSSAPSPPPGQEPSSPDLATSLSSNASHGSIASPSLGYPEARMPQQENPAMMSFDQGS